MIDVLYIGGIVTLASDPMNLHYPIFVSVSGTYFALSIYTFHKDLVKHSDARILEVVYMFCS